MEPSARFTPEGDDLESVITTAELSRRASRTPDYAAESRILASLAQAMAHSPELILQNLAQAALTSCQAGSAGISLIEADGKHFRWHALAGELAPHLWGTTPRSFSPCGTVVDRNSIHLFSNLERHFRYFAEVRPAIVEALLIPFSFESKPVGTIWVVTHDGQRRFDAEDARLIDNLGKFAAAAYQLRSSLAHAEDANRHKDEFLEILSHELRNPLFPMKLVADLLVDKPGSLDDVKRASGVMQRQLSHLQHLVDDLKDVASIGRGKLELRKKRVALSSVVEQAVEASQPIIDMAGHALSVTLPPSPGFVDADPIRLAQVITNLLNNAAKFTARGGHLRVSAEVHDADAVIRVQDDGIGIEAGMLSGIFELYAQVRPADRAAGAGMGIGLTLARSLVEMQGGTIVAHSSGLGKGSEFVVRLPLSADPAQASIATPARTPPKDETGQLRVLVVDDHPDTADSLAWVLHKIGHEARAAYDGPSAIRAFEELSPDVILQDLLMPGTGGLEIVREIRKRSASRRAFVVAITGAVQAAALRASEREAFDHLIVKPVGLKELNETLGKASSRRATDKPRPELSGKADRSNSCYVRGRTDRELPGEYLVRMKTIPMTKPSQHPLDLTLAVHVSPGDTYEWSKVMLARANFNGTLELLTAAWGRFLGYGRQEFVGKTLRQLMRSSKTAAARTVAAILDERNMDPVDLTVRSRSGEAKCLRLHRRLDAYTRKMFIVAEETSVSESGYIPRNGAVRTDRFADGRR